MEAVRGQREHACKCSGAHCNHQQQAQAKSAYGPAKTNALIPSAAPICRMNCWLMVALPMRASTGEHPV